MAAADISGALARTLQFLRANAIACYDLARFGIER